MKHEFNCKFCNIHKVVINKKSKSPIYCSLECNYKDPEKSHGHFEYQKVCEKLKNIKIKQNFYKTVVINTSGCWSWDGELEKDGYARVQVDKKKYKSAHIVSWMIHNGEIPKGLFVLHKCHNRSCTNPNHLHLGTYQDNMDDMTNANRQAKGSRHGSSKLTEDQVIEIKRQLLIPRHAAKIARDFNVSKSLIGAIKQGIVWKHVHLV